MYLSEMHTFFVTIKKKQRALWILESIDKGLVSRSTNWTMYENGKCQAEKGETGYIFFQIFTLAY